MSKPRHILRGMIVVLTIMVIASGIFIALRAAARKTYRVPILMYHEVGDTTDSAWCVPMETFRTQMASLREQGFRAILPSDLIARRKWGKPLPRKPVLITFDDGYLCNLTVIEPILKENGLRAIVYLITRQVAETAPDRREYEGKSCLIWPEVLEMQKRGTLLFGGHSHSHGNLAASADPLPDIAECRNQLKLHGIRQPYSFCYPYGQHNELTQQIVKQAKFETAVVCEDAMAIIGPMTNLFALPRVSVMGGRHDFKLLRKEADVKTLIYQIGHTGIPLEISACRITGDGNAQQVWLPPREVGQGEFELRFAITGNDPRPEQSIVEIWDKHRLFKLATIRE